MCYLGIRRFGVKLFLFSRAQSLVLKQYFIACRFGYTVLYGRYLASLSGCPAEWKSYGSVNLYIAYKLMAGFHDSRLYAFNQPQETNLLFDDESGYPLFSLALNLANFDTGVWIVSPSKISSFCSRASARCLRMQHRSSRLFESQEQLPSSSIR